MRTLLTVSAHSLRFNVGRRLVRFGSAGNLVPTLVNRKQAALTLPGKARRIALNLGLRRERTTGSCALLQDVFEQAVALSLAATSGAAELDKK